MTEELESRLLNLAELWEERAEELKRDKIAGSKMASDTLSDCASQIKKEVERSRDDDKDETDMIDK